MKHAIAGITTAAVIFAVAGLSIVAFQPGTQPANRIAPTLEPARNKQAAKIQVPGAVYDGTSLLLTVRNIGTSAVGELDCELINYTPGRQIDNGSGDAWFDIRGGIEPGETKSLRAFVLPYESDLWLKKGLDKGDRLLGRIGETEFPVKYQPR